MIMFISYHRLGNKEIEVLNFKTKLQTELAQIGVPTVFHPKMLSDPSCRNRYRTTATATRISPTTISIKWDDKDPLNIKNEVICGELTLEWGHQSEVFNLQPKSVIWAEANEAPIIPEFCCLIS